MKVYNLLKKSTGSFLFILALLILYSAIFPEWLYDQIGFMDSFAYLGHILGPVIQRNGFPTHPSGDLLPAILPGHLFYTVLPALYANFIYKVLLAVTITFFLFKIIQKYFGLELAILSIFLTLTNSFFLASIGSNYPVSMVIFYLTTVLYFIVKACENKTKLKIFYLSLIGFFISCMISSAILSVFYIPGFIILFYVLKKNETGKTFDLKDMFIPLGFISGILLLCVVHYSYTHTFIYFQATIKKALSFLEMNRTFGDMKVWVHKARWLGPSAIIIFYSLLKVILTGKTLIWKIINTIKLNIRPENVFLIICNLNFVLLSYLQIFKTQGTITDPYYFSQGLPIITLGLVSIIYKEYKMIIPKNMIAYIGIGFICLLAGCYFQSDSAYKVLFFSLFLIIFLSVILSKTRTNIRSGFSYVFWGSTIVLLLIMSHVPAFWSKYTHQKLSYKDVTTQKINTVHSLKREYFLGAVEWFNLVNELDPSRKTLLWYDITESYGMLFMDFCATSHLWQGGLINQQFPLINVPNNDWTGPSHIAPAEGMDIIVLTSLKDKKLIELNSTLGKKGLRFKILQSVKFNHNFAVFDVIKIKLFRK